ncbi:MAG: ABC transporter substrate-binding protein [Alphaproteobacteria bacterium]
MLAVAGLALLAACGVEEQPADENGLTPIKFATDWRAQAEQGGFYQALATGEYEKRGLAVTIIQGGPSVNVPQLLAAGSVDLGMGSNSFGALNLAAQEVPVKAVAAFMQKDPQVLIAHPDQGIESIADMEGHPILLSDASITEFWVWLKEEYGFTDDQVRKYTFNPAPFLADPRAVQQGYLTSEPYTIEQQSGIKPEVFLLADSGYPGYAAMVLAPDSMIADDPDTVRAFVEASAAGWESFLFGDPAPGNALIMADNPEMTADLIQYAREMMREMQIVKTEDTPIGQMTDERWATFYSIASSQDVYPQGMDFRKAYTLEFLGSAAQ